MYQNVANWMQRAYTHAFIHLGETSLCSQMQKLTPLCTLTRSLHLAGCPFTWIWFQELPAINTPAASADPPGMMRSMNNARDTPLDSKLLQKVTLQRAAKHVALPWHQDSPPYPWLSWAPLCASCGCPLCSYAGTKWPRISQNSRPLIPFLRFIPWDPSWLCKVHNQTSTSKGNER